MHNIAINVLYIFPIMLALCLMLSMIHYVQNYAGVIGWSLAIANLLIVTSLNKSSIASFYLADIGALNKFANISLCGIANATS